MAGKYFTGKPCVHGHIAERYKKTRYCCECARIANAKYRQTAAQKKWRADRREQDAARKRKEYRKNRQAIIAKNNARVKRNKKAQPPWANKKQLDRIYMLAKWADKFTDEPLEIDHIIPLNGEVISGLHTPENLQILPRSQNRAKSNNWPVNIGK